jgi:hypothetical protein
MEKNVVTQIKSSESKTKFKAQAPKRMGGKPDATHAKSRRPRKLAVGDNPVNCSADAHTDEDTLQGSHAAADKPLLSHLLERGKELVSGDTTSVVTATAIVVGAALIEVELIPGLIIGAGAILLGNLLPEIGAFLRPTIKGAVGVGFSITNKARQVMAETSVHVHYLVAEVKHEQGHPRANKKTQGTAGFANDAQSAH